MRERYRHLTALDDQLMVENAPYRRVMEKVAALLLDWESISQQDAEWIRDNGEWMHVGNCWVTVAQLWSDDERQFRFSTLRRRSVAGSDQP